MGHRDTKPKWRCLVCAVLLCALSSCATSASYRYVVAETVSKPIGQQQNEAVFNQPTESPEGTVRVGSMGIVDLKKKGDKNRIPSLHIRTTLSKTSGDGSWKFNLQEQIISFANSAPSAPLYGNSDSTDLPDVEVKTGETRSVDLYFPLPGGSGKDLPSFDFKWLVRSGETALSQTTTFARAPQPESYPSYGYPYDPYPIGYGSFWWGAGWGYYGYPTVAPSIRIRH